MTTNQQFDQVMETCRDLFEKKTKDYGTAWRILRLSSLTDQIYIKACRIRSLQETTEQKIEENEDSEFIGIINYSLMALIQIELGFADKADLTSEKALTHYNIQVKKSKDLMVDKNHDYGEAWRKLRVSSLTDLILQKLLRVKQIEDNQGQTLVREGIEANYLDIINYSVFALIHLTSKQN